MKREFFAMVSVLFLLVFLVGCGSETGYVVKSEEGDTSVKFESSNSNDWCAEGSKWDMTSSDGSAQMVIEGIVSGGKYDGYCHVVYDITTEDAMGNMDFYFDEEGNGYQVIEMNGQKIESSWNNPS